MHRLHLLTQVCMCACVWVQTMTGCIANCDSFCIDDNWYIRLTDTRRIVLRNPKHHASFWTIERDVWLGGWWETKRYSMRDRTIARDIPLRIQQKCHRDECLLSAPNYYIHMYILLRETKQFIYGLGTRYASTIRWRAQCDANGESQWTMSFIITLVAHNENHLWI